MLMVTRICWGLVGQHSNIRADEEINHEEVLLSCSTPPITLAIRNRALAEARGGELSKLDILTNVTDHTSA